MNRFGTVVSFDYLPFFLSFLGSLYSNYGQVANLKVIVLEEDWPTYFIDWLTDHSIVEIRRSKNPTSQIFQGIHSNKWLSSVAKKLEFTEQLLNENNNPLIIIDNDVIFLESIDFLFHVKNYDLILTKMTDYQQIHGRKDGIRLDFIGSLNVYLNIEKSRDFVVLWKDKMKQLAAVTQPPYETPALNLLLQDNTIRRHYSIAAIDDTIICADQQYVGGRTKVLHLKSDGPSRVNPIQNYAQRCAKKDWPPLLFAPNYLNQDIYEAWKLFQLNPDNARRLFGA
jgi:hypothetical protein